MELFLGGETVDKFFLLYIGFIILHFIIGGKKKVGCPVKEKCVQVLASITDFLPFPVLPGHLPIYPSPHLFF